MVVWLYPVQISLSLIGVLGDLDKSMRCLIYMHLTVHDRNMAAPDVGLSVNFISLVTSCVRLREEEPRTAFLVSFTWVSHIATSMLVERQTLPSQSTGYSLMEEIWLSLIEAWQCMPEIWLYMVEIWLYVVEI